jgi:hypothetical protein
MPGAGRRAGLYCGLLALALLLPACVHHHHHHRTAPAQAKVKHAKKGGPPPWAPAHGYRHKHHDGVELVFDGKLGVYVVLGHDHHFFHGDRFYRQHDGKWLVSAQFHGPWVTLAVTDLPSGLRVTRHKKHKHRGRGHPAKIHK